MMIQNALFVTLPLLAVLSALPQHLSAQPVSRTIENLSNSEIISCAAAQSAFLLEERELTDEDIKRLEVGSEIRKFLIEVRGLTKAMVEEKIAFLDLHTFLLALNGNKEAIYAAADRFADVCWIADSE